MSRSDRFAQTCLYHKSSSNTKLGDYGVEKFIGIQPNQSCGGLGNQVRKCVFYEIVFSITQTFMRPIPSLIFWEYDLYFLHCKIFFISATKFEKRNQFKKYNILFLFHNACLKTTKSLFDPFIHKLAQKKATNLSVVFYNLSI